MGQWAFNLAIDEKPLCFPPQGVLLGLSNTAGVLAGVFGTAATGYILQRGTKSPILIFISHVLSFLVVHTQTEESDFFCSASSGSWDDVFKVSVALYILGTLVWNFFSTGEKVLE